LSPDGHIILGVLGYMLRDFAFQMNFNLTNEWDIVRTIVDTVLKMDNGKYVLVKNSNKSMLRLYAVPADTLMKRRGLLR
jgi:translation initiation factor 3 subunit D